MCEWCNRLCMRNYKWDRHVETWGLKWHMFNTMKSQWHKDWYARRDWKRAQNWVEEHSNSGYELGEREYNKAKGIGSRFYDRI